MHNLDDIYNDLIMEHSINSYNKKKLENPSKTEMGINPSCGDEIQIELELDKNIIKDIAFTGQGCAISQSSTSIMIDVLKGKTVEEAKKIIDIFIKMIQRENINESDLKKIEEAVAFKNISTMPARVKCALLAWRTIQKMI